MLDMAPATGCDATLETEPSTRIVWVEPDESFVALCRKRIARMRKTRGLYYFWGRAEAKKRIYNAVHVDGRALSYQGTGSDYYYSFVALAGVFGLLALMVSGLITYAWLTGDVPNIEGITWTRYLAVIPTIFLLGVLTWRGMARELRRTRWAGTAFALSGSPWRYAGVHLATLLAVPLTLGWIIPFRQTRLQRELIGAVRHRDTACTFDGSTRPLYRRFAVIWFGTLLIYFGVVLVLAHTIGPAIVSAGDHGKWSALLGLGTLPWLIGATMLGLIAFGFLHAWYRACTLNAFAPHVSFGGARLTLSLPPVRYAANAIACTAIRLCSLSLYGPVADARAMRFFVSHADLTTTPSKDATR